jgi:3-hydroxyisobutyrate dehydrogenase
MLDIVNASTGRSFATEGAIKAQVLTGKFAAGFSLGLLTKDIKIAADLASELGVLAPGVSLLQNAYADARGALGYNADFTAAFKHWTRDVKKA